MKKILILLSVVVVCLILSCVPEKRDDYEKDPKLGYSVIDYVNFDGHQYVYYRHGDYGSLCHSPKCQCLEKYKKQ